MFEFIHNVRDNNVIINGDVFTEEDFMEVVPDYSVSQSTSYVHYIPGKKHTIVVNGVIKTKPLIWDFGDFCISKHNDIKLYRNHKEGMKEHSKPEDKKQMVSPDKSYDENRKVEYPSTDELIIALWEALIEKSASGKKRVKELESLRKSIKNRFPKNA